MKRFGAPRRTVPRRPGANSARFIDAATSLPNRVSIMTELEFALTQHPHYVAVVIAHVDEVPNQVSAQDPVSAARLVAVAAQLRKAVRPTDMVGRLGPTEVGAALWGLESPEPADIVHRRVQQYLAEEMFTAGQQRVPVTAVAAIGVVPPMATGAEAISAAWLALESAKARRIAPRRAS